MSPGQRSKPASLAVGELDRLEVLTAGAWWTTG
jgi:hypothetical protein